MFKNSSQAWPITLVLLSFFSGSATSAEPDPATEKKNGSVINSMAHSQLFNAVSKVNKALTLEYGIERKLQPEFNSGVASYPTAKYSISFLGDGNSRRCYLRLSTLVTSKDVVSNAPYPTALTTGYDSKFIPRIFQQINLSSSTTIRYPDRPSDHAVALLADRLGHAPNRSGMPVDPFHFHLYVVAILLWDGNLESSTGVFPCAPGDLLDDKPIIISTDEKERILRDGRSITIVTSKANEILALTRLESREINFQAAGSSFTVENLPVMQESRMYRQVLRKCSWESASDLDDEYETVARSASRAMDEQSGSSYNMNDTQELPDAPGTH
jgi:hypothetical protein